MTEHDALHGLLVDLPNKTSHQLMVRSALQPLPLAATHTAWSAARHVGDGQPLRSVVPARGRKSARVSQPAARRLTRHGGRQAANIHTRPIAQRPTSLQQQQQQPHHTSPASMWLPCATWGAVHTKATLNVESTCLTAQSPSAFRSFCSFACSQSTHVGSMADQEPCRYASSGHRSSGHSRQPLCSLATAGAHARLPPGGTPGWRACPHVQPACPTPLSRQLPQGCCI